MLPSQGPSIANATIASLTSGPGEFQDAAITPHRVSLTNRSRAVLRASGGERFPNAFRTHPTPPPPTSAAGQPLADRPPTGQDTAAVDGTQATLHPAAMSDSDASATYLKSPSLVPHPQPHRLPATNKIVPYPTIHA